MELPVECRRTAAPSLPPLTLPEARRQCQVPADLTDQDLLIAGLIAAVADACENHTSRSLLTQSWTMAIGGWFADCWLPRATPLRSITSIKYYAPAGTLTTLDPSYYIIDTVSEPGRVMRAPGMSWPALQADRRLPVEIVYATGESSAASIPPALKQGMLLLLGHWFTERQAVNVGNITSVLPFGVDACWSPYRVWSRPAVRA